MSKYVIAVVVLSAGCAAGGSMPDSRASAADEGDRDHSSATLTLGGAGGAGLETASAASAAIGARAGSGGAGGVGGSGDEAENAMANAIAGAGGAPAAGCDVVAGPAASPTKANGESCAAASDCQSGNCATGGDGARRCYGTAGANEMCGGVFDCNGGICAPDTLAGDQAVCIPGFADCAPLGDECQLTSIVVCQFVQSCGSNVSSDVPARYTTDFDYCVSTECKGTTLSESDCMTLRNSIMSGSAPCP